MKEDRDTYKYEVKRGSRTVYRGITGDIKRREMEHKARWSDCKVEQVGKKVTRENALKWRREHERHTSSRW
jgi:predicted GIY-YIG superfamily endonuclease